MSIGWPFLLCNHSNKASHIWQTILIFHCIYLMNILRPLPAKLDHFYLFDPLEPKIWPLTFSSITTKRYVVDRSNYTFFWILITKGICWYGPRQHWSNFWIWPLYKLSCDPQASCTGCDPAAIWNSDPWTPTNIMKLSNLLFLFSWVNFASIRPRVRPTESLFMLSKYIEIWMLIESMCQNFDASRWWRCWHAK